MDRAPIVYLTCEIKGRDFKSRLLIAAYLVKMGYTVVVGQYWNLRHNCYHALRGCYLFKTANHFQAEGMRMCREAGHAVVASDEEALSTAAALAAHTVDAMAIDNCDLFLTLNLSHRRALEKAFPVVRRKAKVVGTARADLICGEAYERPHPRPYILVNTSFGRINSIWGNEQAGIYAQALGLDLENPDHQAIIDMRERYERLALEETVQVVEWLVANDASWDVVVRPHPSEQPDFWRRMPRVRVVAGSDPYPWMKYADLILHSDSTLGVEAAIMGAPTLNLSPTEEWAARLNVREVNKTVRTAAEAIIVLQDPNAWPKGISRTIVPVHGAANTAKAIAGLLPRPQNFTQIPWGRTPRTEVQIAKFDVRLEECRAAAAEVFPLAGNPPVHIDELYDSVFLLRPA